jgi:hypothetical protein
VSVHRRALVPALVGLGLALLSPAASAHHGKDFFLVETYEVPHPRTVYAIADAAWARTGSADALALEPGLLGGVVDRVALEVHAHFFREPGGTLRYEAVAPAIHLQLSPPEALQGFALGVSGEYEIAGGGSDEGNRLEARAIVERSLPSFKAAVNLIGSRLEGEDPVWGYAMGFRREFSPKIAAGIEAQGEFQEDSAHQILLGCYVEPTERYTIKAGAGSELGPNHADVVGQLGLVWSF